MSRSNGISPSTATVITAYFAGIITVAVLCCDGWREVADAINQPATASSSRISSLAFVFYEESEDITGVTASVHIGSSEQVLEEVQLYWTDGALVVETWAETGKVFRPHFYFLNRKNEVVKEYRANLTPDRSLITYHDLSFGEDEQFPYHNLPQEFQASVGENAVPLEGEQRMWIGNRFADIRRIIELPPNADADCECQMFVFHPPSTIVGITSDGTEGDIVSLEVLLP